MRALVVVLVCAIALFVVLRPICLRFMSDADFRRRRNVWILTTIAVFVAPNIWVFLLVSVPIWLWAAKRDSNPLALYVCLLYAAPDVDVAIPVFWSGGLFDINHIRALGLVILLPLAFRLWKERSRLEPVIGGAGWLLLAYCALQFVLTPYLSVTSSLRQTFLLTLDYVLVYYVVSRGLTAQKQVHEVLMMHVVAFAILAPLAMVEATRFWLLYGDIYERWEEYSFGRMMLRGGSLRAQLSAGHPLSLGFLAAMAFGFWVMLGSRVESRVKHWFGAAWLWLGLLAAYSRGPWLTAVAVFLTYVALSPRGLGRFAKTALWGSVAAVFVLLSPLGERVIASLPFVGTVESGTVDYRQRLLDVAAELIAENPFFGDPNILARLEYLRDGMGVIDLVNGYIYVALYYGLVTLATVVGFFAVCGLRANRARRHGAADGDHDVQDMGAILVACTLGTFVHIGTAGFEHLMWVAAGLASGYARLCQPAPLQAKSRSHVSAY